MFVTLKIAPFWLLFAIGSLLVSGAVAEELLVSVQSANETDNNGSTNRAYCGYDACLKTLSIQLTLKNTGSRCQYYVKVSWGDGTSSTASYTSKKAVYHKYKTYGIKTIKMSLIRCKCALPGQRCSFRTASTTIQLTRPGGSSGGTCGSYNSNIYTCCDGVLNLGRGQSCCGTKGFNSDIYTCCNEVLNLGRGQSCCDTKGFNSDTETCCNGVLNLGRGQSCCGTKGFNPSIYTCCDGVLKLGQGASCGGACTGTSCCGVQSYNPDIETCCNGVLNLGRGQSCCGTKGFNADMETCCNGVLNLGRGQSCCGTKGFNSDMETCCNGVLNLGRGQSCCGTKGFNPSIYTCCDGVLKLGQGASCGGACTGTSCCGVQSYNPDIETCCNGVLNLGRGQSCCGTKGFNADMETCCNGVLNLGRGQSCCGTKGFNSDMETCCNGVLNLGRGQSCCGTKGFNPSIYTCCNGVLTLGQGASCGGGGGGGGGGGSGTLTPKIDITPFGLSNGVVGSPYSFTFVAKNLPASISTAKISWNFGDGSSTATGMNTVSVSSGQASTTASHTYTVNGVYALTVSALDVSGKSLAENATVVAIGGGGNATTIVLDACGTWMAAKQGGAGATVNNWDISTIPAGSLFDFKYDAQSIPDRFEVTYMGVTKLSTGWRGSSSYDGDPLYPGGIQGPGAGESDRIFAKSTSNTFTVSVFGGGPGTIWDYDVRCGSP